MVPRFRTAVLLILPLVAHALKTTSSGDGLTTQKMEDEKIGAVPFGRALLKQFLLADGYTSSFTFPQVCTRGGSEIGGLLVQTV